MSLLTVSCKKENEVNPSSSAPARAINVEYRITSETSSVNALYLYPDANGKLISTQQVINRSPYSITFASTTGNFFSVEAANVVAQHKMVNVQIYIDGVLFQEATSYSPSQKAVASGNY